MDVVSCRYCGKEAKVFRQESGVSVCPSCFFKEISRKVFRTITRNRMLAPKDSCVVAFSGGKDSQVLLEHVVKYQRRKAIGMPPVALTVDEGIGGYRDESLDMARDFCGNLGIRHVVISFKRVFGKSLDEIVESASEIGEKWSACTYCGILRRYLLNYGARELGANVLATGHNLNDEVETFLMNIARGDLQGIRRLKPKLDSSLTTVVSRVKPLRGIPEQDITLYCFYKGYAFQEVPCPYSSRDPILRGIVQRFLNELDKRNHEIKFNILKIGDQMREIVDREVTGTTPNTCQQCGAATSPGRRTCKTCEIREKLGLELNLTGLDE
ncbi:MAG: ATP-binding protein [Promethearchaeota archaeon]